MNQFELLKYLALYGYKAFGLSATNIAFLSSLLAYYNYITCECWPSNESIKNATGIEASNLHRNKKELVKAGVVELFNKPLGDGKKHSGYIIKVNFMEERFKQILAEEAAKEAETITEAEMFSPEPVEEAQQESLFDDVQPEATETPLEPREAKGDVITFPEPYSVPVSVTERFASVNEAIEAMKAFNPMHTDLTVSSWVHSLKSKGEATTRTPNNLKQTFYLKEVA